MGRSIPIPSPSPPNLQRFSRLIAPPPRRPAQFKPKSVAEPIPESPKQRVRTRRMEAAENSERQRSTPLAKVVTDCSKRWFHDALKEAKSGDIAMQVLVGQMYTSGYGVVKDAQKGKAWINRASRSRSAVWKVGDKRPGYAASDSDSAEEGEEVEEEAT